MELKQHTRHGIKLNKLIKMNFNVNTYNLLQYSDDSYNKSSLWKNHAAPKLIAGGAKLVAATT